LSKLSVRVDLV